jgi:hypothetical protein
MNGSHFVRLVSAALTAVVILGCGTEPVVESVSLGIEPIAAVVDGVVQWDPNDGSILYLHASGIPDDELDQVIWTQSGLSIADTLFIGPVLALNAGGEGCGYGGLDFSINVVNPSRNSTASVRVRMARYVCSGSPWTSQ